MVETQIDQIFEDIVETIRDPFLVLDSDLKVISANRSFIDSFKVTREETLGNFIYDLGNKQWDIPKLRELLETILPQQTVFDNYEVEHDFATIGRRIMLLNARQVERAVGKERIILLAIEDITERKKIEDGLEKTRKELAIIKKTADEASEFAESVINTVREPLISLDQDLRVVTVSRSFYEFFKVKPEETVGQLIYDLGNKQWDIPKLRELLETILPQETTFDNYEVEHDFATIGRRTMLLNARQIEQAMGRERIILLAIEDITERRQLEDLLAESAGQTIKESEERYRIIFEGAAEGILVADMETQRFKYCNPAICEMLGYSEEELIELDVTDIHPKESLDHVLADFETQARGDKHLSPSIPCLRKDGSVFYADVQTTPGIIDGLECNVGFFTDVTKRRQIEAQLRQAQKMEAIGTLAGGVAHDFNNILTTIIGYADLMLMDIDTEKPLTEEIKEIKIAGERAAALTRQLLAFSRKQIVQPEILDLNKLLTGIEKMLVRLIGEDIEILMIQESALWKVEIDPGQMEQVIMNLAVNAKDAMPLGGKLTIETANMDLNDNHFDEHGIVEKQTGSYVVLTVSDTGIGMDKGVQEYIFDPFYTTKEKGKGTGLGLSTIYGIVKQNNGFIWVYSEPGQGSTFKIYLPRVKRDIKAEKKEQPPVENLRGSETVLIVEDDNSIRKLAQKSLQPHGYRVLVAENGEDALRTSKEHGGPIDLIVTDVVMPKMSGKETAERLQALHPQMKVIYMSGYTDDAIVRHGVLAPGLNFLEKPFSPGGLARKVREVLDKK
ncbi:MAG: PAS domain S-box protein [Deltaproteobacteria bacterium]|nr:PAS domain S-box protein [Deltaproteobacteria bacterium]